MRRQGAVHAVKSPSASWWSAVFPPRFLASLLAVSVLTNVALLLRLAYPAKWDTWRLSWYRPPSVTAEDHVLGSGATTVIEYGDFECPFCAGFHDAMRELAAEGTVRWVYRHYPLSAIHPQAVVAAEATECAAEQGRFWAFADALYAHQGNIDRAALTTLAAAVGANRHRFDACVDGGGYQERIAAQVEAARRLGIRATPTFFVDGKRYEGFVSRDSLRALVQAHQKASD